MRLPYILSIAMLLAATGLLRAAEPHPSLPRAVIPECLGVSIHFTDPQIGELEMLAAAGFRWVRMDLNWAATEQQKGKYDFSAYDRLTVALSKSNLRAVFILDYGNALYAEPGDVHPFTSRAQTPEFREAFGRWATAAVQHFKGRGYLWEMWNEPNGFFWKSPDKTGDYIALAKSTGEALRQAGLLGAKGEAFIGPATAGIDLPFLTACGKAGLLEYWDAVSVHPYRDTAPETAEEQFRRVRLLIHQYAPKDKAIPIISSEWGYSDAWRGHSRELQATYLQRQLLTNIANDVALSIWYDWHDDGADPKDSEGHFGLVGNEYHAGRQLVFDPKPAYLAMKTLHENLNGFAFNKRLSFEGEGGQDDHVLLFESKNEVRVAAWTAAKDSHSIQLPVSNGKVMMIDRQGRMTYDTVQKTTGMELFPTVEVRLLRFPQSNPLLLTAASITRLPLEMIFEMPGHAPKFRFGLTNHVPEAAFVRTGRWDVLTKPTKPGEKAVPSQRVASRATLETALDVESAQRSIDGADTLEMGVGVTPASAQKETSSQKYHRNWTQSPETFIFQSTRLEAANPLIVTRLPDTATEIVVKIENPSGEAWEGTVAPFMASHGGGWPTTGEVTRTVLDRVPLTLPKNVPFVIKHIPLPADRAKVWWRGVAGIAWQSGTAFPSFMPIMDNAPVMLDLPNVQIVADGDPKIGLELSHQIEQPADGSVAEDIPSLRVNYSFRAGGRRSLRVVNPTWPPPEEKNLLQQPESLSVWIYGDGNGCRTWMRFVDSTNQFFQSIGPRINWTGWRQVTFAMRTDKGHLEHGDGADDGQIHYPIELDSILVLENVTGGAVAGSVYLSAPTLNF